jgi:phosphomannomutase/phosphoglucomutase
MSSKTLEQEILEELEGEKAAKAPSGKNGKESPKKEKDSADSVEPKVANALLIPFVMMLVSIWFGAVAVVAAIEFGIARDLKLQSSMHYVDTLRNNAQNDLDHAFASIQEQLDSLAASEGVKNAITLDTPEDQAILATTLKTGFPNSESLLIVPWDYTGTAGLKDRDLPLRNNIEIMMITKAGSKKSVPPEAYIHQDKWLVSFVSPVIQDGQVIGALLLTMNREFMTTLIDTPELKKGASIRIIHNEKKEKPIATVGSDSNLGEFTQQTAVPLPFTSGSLVIRIDTEKNPAGEIPFYLFYALIGALALLLSVIWIVIHMQYIRSITLNSMIVVRFAESKTGMHKTRRPKLSIPVMEVILDAVDILGNSATKSMVTPADPNKTVAARAVSAPPPEKMALADVNEGNPFPFPEIFKDYEIRGIAEIQLDPENAIMIGKAIGSEALSRNIPTLVIGRDGRPSSERIQKNLIKGITATGCNATDIGLVPTPLFYYATSKLGTQAGVMVTGSHLAPEFNGLKVLFEGKTQQGVQLQNLLKRIEKYQFAEGKGIFTQMNVDSDYENEVCGDIIIARPLKVVVDGAFGPGGALAVRLLGRLDCEVIPLHCEPDGAEPDHVPDPSRPENLTLLVDKIREEHADLGIAFDGDADRMVAVSSSGRIIEGDRLLMIFARDIVSRNPAAGVVFDTKCTSLLSGAITEFGGRPIQTRCGAPYLRAKMQESGALLAGGFTGHYLFTERWHGFDDGIYAALRLIELLTTEDTPLDARLEALPQSARCGEQVIPTASVDERIRIIHRLRDLLATEEGSINTQDGIRVDYEKGWGLVRISSSTEQLTAHFEALDEEELLRIERIFREALHTINPKLQLTF